MRFRDEPAVADWLRKRDTAKRPSLRRGLRRDLASCFAVIDEDDDPNGEGFRVYFSGFRVPDGRQEDDSGRTNLETTRNSPS
jgi:hypothetical protein